ncbi:MAG TPA: MMPL family transporter [Thermoanaerobaculia bacterium]|nr:MMPL family transporter [Thermoanaerobaculia bacterium]
MISRLIERVTGLVLRKPGTILIVTLLVVAASGLIASRMRLDPDVLKLVPQNNREVNEFREILTETGTLDFHVVVIQFPKGADPATYGPLIDGIGERLRASKNIDNATWRVPDPFAVIDKVLPYSLLILEPQQLDAVAAKLSDEGIREAVERNRTLLQTPQSSVVKQFVRIDPFNLLPVYVDKLKRAGGGLNVDFSTGYYVATDQSAAVIIARPKKAAQDLPFSRVIMEETHAFADQAMQEFRAANPNVPVPVLGYTGGYAIAAEDEKIIRQDMAVNSVTSFLGVLLLYFYAYRRPSAILYAAVPMTAAIVITFAIGALTFGTLSAASTGFAALLAGLGVDFMTVMYERYVDERNRGASVVEAVRMLMRHALPGVIVGALTTAATFYAFLATDFRGMTQLGYLTGTGILVFLICVVFVLPALIVIVERRREGKREVKVHAVGSTRILRASLRHPRAVVIGWAIAVAICGVLALRVRFSDSIQNLRSKGNPGIQLQEVVTKKFGQSFEFMMYGVRGRTASEAIAKTEAAMPDLERIAQKKIIGSYQSITTFLPSEQQQRQVIARLQAGSSDEFSWLRIERTFRQALVDNGFREDAYDRILPLYAEAVQQRRPLTIETLQSLGLGESLQRFMKKTPTGYMSIVYVYPTTGTWPRFLPDELQEFRRKHPEGALTGVNLVSQTLRTITRNDAIRASLIGFIVVFGLLWIGFRSFSRACLVFVPFVAGCTCMLGFMATFNLEFNFMNIFAGLMLVGTATDYAVYMLQRYDEAPDRFEENAPETARAVTLAALMSIVGFASFAISHYPGVRSLGIASTFGIALSCLASITLLPALLQSGRFRHRNASMIGEPPPED